MKRLQKGTAKMPEEASHYHRDFVKVTRTDIKPLDIVQPEGPSFKVGCPGRMGQTWDKQNKMDKIISINQMSKFVAKKVRHALASNTTLLARLWPTACKVATQAQDAKHACLEGPR